MQQKKPALVSTENLFSLLRYLVPTLELVLLIGFFAVSAGGFWSGENFGNILNQNAAIGVLAIGQAFVMIGGGFDLSQGAIVGFAGATVALMLRANAITVPAAVCAGILVAAGLAALLGRRGLAPAVRWTVSAALGIAVGWLLVGRPANLPVALFFGLVTGAGLGALNGFLVSRVRINPFVTTLATQIVLRAATIIILAGQPITNPSRFLQQLYSKGVVVPVLGFIQTPALLFLGLVLAGLLLLRFTRFGRHVYAIGSNDEAARLAGVPTHGVRIWTYVLSGVAAAVAGILIFARVNYATTDAGATLELESIASCIIGGIGLGGGTGGVVSAFIGRFLLGVLENGLTLSTIAGEAIRPEWRAIAMGALIVVAAAADALLRRRGTH